MATRKNSSDVEDELLNSLNLVTDIMNEILETQKAIRDEIMKVPDETSDI